MIRPNRPLVLEAPGRAADGAGGYVTTWVALGTLWAAIAPGAGRAGAQDAVMQPLAITLRAAPPGAPTRPVAGQRFREGARVFTILSVSDSGDGRWLTCAAQEEAVP